MQRPGLQFVTLLLSSLLMIRISVVSGFYFPQSDLTLRFPYSPRNDANEIKLIGLRTLRNDSATPQNVEYLILMPQEKSVIYLRNTSDVILRNLPKNGTLHIVIKATEKNFGEAVLKIKVQPVPMMERTINCTDFIKDMCFWNTSRYKIYENQPVTMIGMFGPEAYSNVCPKFRVRYDLLNGTEYFHVVDDKLFANASLDRDIIGPPGGPGPNIKIQVRCVVFEEETGLQHVQTDVLTIDILDEDDNPPTAQGNTSIAITFKDVAKGQRLVDENSLLLKDADAVTSNQYSTRLLGDTSNALSLSYSILPIKHPMLVDQAPYTAILPKIVAKKTVLPKSPYIVVLQVTDESLLAGYGANSVNISITFSRPVHQALTTTALSTI